MQAALHDNKPLNLQNWLNIVKHRLTSAIISIFIYTFAANLIPNIGNIAK